jgi:hypothetical protein
MDDEYRVAVEVSGETNSPLSCSIAVLKRSLFCTNDALNINHEHVAMDYKNYDVVVLVAHLEARRC